MADLVRVATDSKTLAIQRLLSMYESFRPFRSQTSTGGIDAVLQHFVEWFSGKDLAISWLKNNRSGSGTFAMIDAVDEGFSIICNAAAGSLSVIDRNQIHHYAFDGSVFIGIMKRVTVANAALEWGGINGNGYGSTTDKAALLEASNRTFKTLRTADGSSSTLVDSSVNTDEAFTLYKIETKASNVQMSILGVLEAVSTTTLPDVKLQLTFNSHNLTPVIVESRIRYFEAYNT